MKKLSEEAYLTLRERSKTLEADLHGEKVLQLADGTYLKLFRVKKLFSSARFYPYSKRFANNAVKLVGLGIPTVSIIESYKIPFLRRTAVHYVPLTGRTLRAQPNGIDHILAEKLGAFIRELHEKGIFFRSLHLGNIVLTPENKLGLIDIADMSIYRQNLSEKLIIRNFKHFLRYKEDLETQISSLQSLMKGYNPPPALLKKIGRLIDVDL